MPTFVADEPLWLNAWIGTSNLDIRSFALNAEIVLLFYDGGLCARLSKKQSRYLREGELLDAAAWQTRPLAMKVAENLARLLSPLL